jgi:hypothetical protein
VPSVFGAASLGFARVSRRHPVNVMRGRERTDPFGPFARTAAAPAANG